MLEGTPRRVAEYLPLIAQAQLYARLRELGFGPAEIKIKTGINPEALASSKPRSALVFPVGYRRG